MDRTSTLLSGKEVVQHHRTCSKELPEIGVKLYEPSGSWFEGNKLSYALDERSSLLKEPRIERDNLLSVAKWDEEKKRVVVLKKKGKEWETYGHHDSKENIDILNPEEALFLLESNSLILFHEDVELSVEIGYSLLLNPVYGCTLDQYRVFAHLSRLGYKLIRHKKSEVNNESDKIVSPSEDCLTVLNEKNPVESKNNHLSIQSSPIIQPSSSGLAKDNDVVLIEDSSSDSNDIEIIGFIDGSKARDVINIEDDDSSDSDVVMLEAPGLVELPLKNWPFIHRRKFLSTHYNCNDPIIIDALVSAQLERDILDEIPNIKGTKAWLFRPNEILLPEGVWPFHYKYLIDLNDERGDRGFRGRGGFRGRNFRARGWYLQRQVSQMKDYTFSLMTMVSQVMGAQYLQSITPPRALFQGPNYRSPRGNRSWGRISFNRRGTHFCPNFASNYTGITEIVELSDDEGEGSSNKRSITNDDNREVEHNDTKRLKLEPDIISSDSCSSIKTEPMVIIKPELISTAECSASVESNLILPEIKTEIKSEGKDTTTLNNLGIVKKEDDCGNIGSKLVNSTVLPESLNNSEGVNTITNPSYGELLQPSFKMEPDANVGNDNSVKKSVPPNLNINKINCEASCNESPSCSNNVKSEPNQESESVSQIVKNEAFTEMTKAHIITETEMETNSVEMEVVSKEDIFETMKVNNADASLKIKSNSICQEVNPSNSIKTDVCSDSTSAHHVYSTQSEKTDESTDPASMYQGVNTDGKKGLQLAINDTCLEVNINKGKEENKTDTNQDLGIETLKTEKLNPADSCKVFNVKGKIVDKNMDITETPIKICTENDNIKLKDDLKLETRGSTDCQQKSIGKYENISDNSENTNTNQTLTNDSSLQKSNIELKQVNSAENIDSVDRGVEVDSVEMEESVAMTFQSSVYNESISSSSFGKKAKKSSLSESFREDGSVVIDSDNINDSSKRDFDDNSCDQSLKRSKTVKDSEANSEISKEDSRKKDTDDTFKNSDERLADLGVSQSKDKDDTINSSADLGVSQSSTIVIDSEDKDSSCQEIYDLDDKSNSENVDSCPNPTNDFPRNTSCWKMLKENDKNQSQIQNSIQDHRTSMEDGTNINYGSHLLNEEHCTSLDNVLKRLQIFSLYKSAREIDESQQIKVSYDVYLPSSSYYRHSPNPDFRLVILGLDDSVPDAEQMMHLRQLYNDDKNFLFAVILRESIAYYLYDNVNLPVDNIPL